jgi:hypothetical protein
MSKFFLLLFIAKRHQVSKPPQFGGGEDHCKIQMAGGVEISTLRYLDPMMDKNGLMAGSAETL